MKLTVNEIPFKKGQLVGRYRLRLTDGRTEMYRGARFVDGVTAEPADGKTTVRLHQAFGHRLVVEAWDAETLSMVTDQLRDRGEEARAAELSSPAVRANTPTAPPVVDFKDDLDIMSRIELMELAKELGLSPHWNSGELKLRELIRGHRVHDQG